MLNELKKLVSKSVSAENCGKSLSLMVWEQGYQGIYEKVIANYNYSEDKLALHIASIYLFSYYVATERNAFNLSKKILDNIRYAFKYYLSENLLVNYSFEKSRHSSIFMQLEKEAQIYMDLYNYEYENIDSKVIAFIIEDLAAYKKAEHQEKDDQEIGNLLRNLTFNTVTIIQDYLIDLSVKKKVVCKYKNRKKSKLIESKEA